MGDCFKEFLDAEIKEILASMDSRCRENPKLCSELAMKWIEEHAEEFRKKWFSQKLAKKSKENIVSKSV